MPPAVIAAGIAAAGALGGAKLSSNAAKSAAKTQETAGNKALDLQRDIYGQQKTLLNPYVTAGTESLGRLMSQHWGGAYTGPGGPTVMAPNPYAPDPRSVVQGGAPMPMGGMTPQQPQGGPSLGQMGQSVIVEAPTGERQRLPWALAQAAQAKGARILGGF